MTIWVDADECPKVVKEILFRAAHREHVEVVLVANMALQYPQSPYVRMVRAPRGFQPEDHHIVREAKSGDLVVTTDLPLAAGALGKGALGLSPHGEWIVVDGIGGSPSLRGFVDGMEGAGNVPDDPEAIGAYEGQCFSLALDRCLEAMIHA